MLGFTTKYKENREFREFCGQIDSLAFLPKRFVYAGLQHLKNICSAENKEILTYFETNYISRGQKRTRDGKLINLPPKFPISLWNVHDAILSDNPKTNNQCEGWNNKFYHLVGSKHPNIWKLIQCLQDEESSVEMVESKFINGVRPKSKTKRIFVQLQIQLKNLCQDFLENRKALEEFLSTCGKLIRFRLE